MRASNDGGSNIGTLSDRELLNELALTVATERRTTARLIALLMEVDARKLYLGEGFSSLFTYCTQALHIAEHAAYNRIEAARAAQRFPLALDMIKSGDVTLTAVRPLSQPTDASAGVLPGVQQILSTSAPVQVATTGMRGRTDLKALAPARYKVQFTTSREAYEKLRRAQALLRHVIPDGDPPLIIERALALLVSELSGEKPARPIVPVPLSRQTVERGTYLRPSREQSGSAMRAGARSSAPSGGVQRRAFSNTTTSCRSLKAEKRRPAMSRCAVARTTHTRRRST